jgi:hypothetical protein
MTIAVVCLLVAGCNEEACRPTAMLIGGFDFDSEKEVITGRAGLQNPDGVEFGVESRHITDLNQSYGAYALVETQLIDFGTQYFGAHAGIIDSQYYGLIAGETIPIRDNISAVIEVQWNELDDTQRAIIGTDDELVAHTGVKIKF